MDVDVVEVRVHIEYLLPRYSIRRLRGGGGRAAREDSAAETSTHVTPEKGVAARAAGVFVRPILFIHLLVAMGDCRPCITAERVACSR